ncbi:MAG: type II secretion system F family protein [Candidatus Kerfeldbacteria bacterium]|nr:type II secretion system F family protein [Candidatus Kerfeldbacteria bacterium]
MKDIELSFWVSRKDIAFFTKNFAVMLTAGLTVVESLAVSEEQAKGKLKRILADTIHYVEQGNGLSDALARHRRQFSSIYIDVVRTGEQSGNLARNVHQLSIRLADDLELRRKVRGAMIYPAIVFAGLLVLGTTLSLVVFPRFIKLFNSIDVPLPAMTKGLIWLAQWLQHYWVWLLIGLAIVTISIRLLSRIAVFEMIWHRLLLVLPIVGPIIQQVNLTRFTSTLGSLLKSGVPISEALHSVIHSCTNLAYQQSIRAALREVEQGATLTAAIGQYRHLFPPLVVRMIAVGERTGQLDELLLYLGNYYDGQVDTSTKQLGILIEPILLIVIGVMVLIVGLAVVVPIYQFTAAIGSL